MKALILMIALLPLLALALTGCGESAEAHSSAGVTLQQQGQLNAAIAEFDEAIELDSEFASVYNSRGIAYPNLNKSEKAITDFGHAIRLDPKLAGLISIEVSPISLLVTWRRTKRMPRKR